MNHQKPGQYGSAGEGSSGWENGGPPPLPQNTPQVPPTADMSEPTPAPRFPRREVADKDIGSVLRGWDYEPGTINVRKVSGLDGKPKLQMRLDLGLLQMEMTGRPDGLKPFGAESLLDHQEHQLEEHRRKHSTDLGFQLSSDDCQALRDESVMYYQRYLSLFVLEEFAAVVRDTSRNLRLLDFCGQYALEEDDRLTLEQYRPYILMMNARAKASLHLKGRQVKEALGDVDEGLSQIREFFDKIGQPEVFPKANEVKVLKRFAKEVRKKLPVDPVKRAQKRLDRAVKEERYEEAARLRDQLAAMKGEPEGPQRTRA